MASINFDFEGASRSTCSVRGERAFDVLVTPEHAPPINPSAWYAFRYEAQPGEAIRVTLRYALSSHRYQPQWRGSGDASLLAVTVAEGGESATVTLPPGRGLVSAQELVTGAHYHDWLARLQDMGGQRLELGLSHDRRRVEAVRIGRADAPRLIVLIGRQHPPEVTGAIAMETFVDRLAARIAAAGDGPLTQYQLLIVPLLNPDGVARGHWRANLGGVDLNRDWGPFTQPETRAVRDWLAALPEGVRPALMLDFHSTGRNLFYVQGDEAGPVGEAFLAAWLGGRENQFAGYPFTIERRDANPGSGTSKNWFHGTYGIPAYTYEVGDNADRDATRAAAHALADGLPAALAALDAAQ